MLLESEKHEMVAQMKRELGYSNPIALLVEMTSKFDVPTVKRIIEKLEQVRDAVVVGQAEEDAREQQAIQVFQTMVSELTEVREKLASDYEESAQIFRKKSNDKVRGGSAIV